MIVDSLRVLDSLKAVVDSAAISCADSLQLLNNPTQNETARSQGVGALWSALLIFILGLLADAIVRNIIKRRSLKTMRDTIVFWYEKEARFLGKGIESVGDLAKIISNAVIFQPEAAMIPDINLARLTEFRLDELFSVFVGNMRYKQDAKLNHLYNFQKSCRYINLTIAEVRKTHENYVDDVRSLMEEWNTATKHLHNELSALPDSFAAEEWLRLCDICKSKGGGDFDNMDVEKWEECVINPFLVFIDANKGKLPRTVLFGLQAMKVVFMKFRGTRQYGQLFAAYANHMNASAEALKESVTFLKSVKMKLWVH